ncbi:SDR family oxidoreductase [Macrococcoides bohemicum]|uniref:SDR family oxidoreductase n=1 Tax=Macrococcoides bohemicum TaxID=1903056 RepID=UPI00165E43A4|nr:SDR family oxidoreductase [Macrococcus bohemicus]MBC9873969.1 SDR family oxidoreductase [Macrococcus bohemicus]
MNVNQLPLKNKSIFITGVSTTRGIGYAVALECAKQGASIFIQYFKSSETSEDFQNVCTGIKQKLIEGAKFNYIHVNFENDSFVDEIELFMRQNGTMDYIICNHALSGYDGYLLETTSENLDKHWQINTKSSILLSKLFVKQHDQKNRGKIIFMTSGQTLGPMPNEISYALSKGALKEIVKSLAHDLANKNITVNAINPSVTNTGYLDGYDLSEWIETSFPFGRLSDPQDTANLITFLLSDKGSWITGQIINSEGGFVR